MPGESLREERLLTKQLPLVLAVLALSLTLSACSARRAATTPQVATGAPTAAATTAATATPDTSKVVEKAATEQTPTTASGQGSKAPEAYTTPHSILSDVRVRQAIADCVDRDALIASVYPFLSAQQRNELRMDATLPKAHWAYRGPYGDYEHSVAKGTALLEEAGWTLAEGATFRMNATNAALSLKLTTTTAPFRETWAAVAAESVAACGIELVPQYTEASWWLGDATGLARRDFELGAFAWAGDSDPRGAVLYACDAIPLASNNWQGQNYMGWCNQTASDAIVAAGLTLERNRRISEYDTFHKEFARNMVSLPLFQHLQVAAWAPNLEGIRVSPTESALAGAASWKRKDGKDSVVVGLAQEPATLFGLVDRGDATSQVYRLGVSAINTQFDFNYQPGIQDPLSTVENGLAISSTVEVKAGDGVLTALGTPARLAKGVKVFDADGKEVSYDGTSTIKMKQLVSTYKFHEYKWSDGTPGAAADLDLGYLIDCDPESGNTSFELCDQVAEFRAGPNLEYTIKWLPGAHPWLYFLAPFHVYPSYQVLSDGRKLAEVPAAEWAALPEIAAKPLSMAPFVLKEWKKGESLTFERNKYYEPAPVLQTIVIRFFPDSQAAMDALMKGEVDYLDQAVVGTGAAAQAALAAVKDGKLAVRAMGSATWEHLDFNLFAK
jgi:ABC-type transport system substrate-binding protein